MHRLLKTVRVSFTVADVVLHWHRAPDPEFGDVQSFAYEERLLGHPPLPFGFSEDALFELFMTKFH